MAFSYSDKNFTVIGNLCFVHIAVEDNLLHYDIPPAIVDRMLIDDFHCVYIAGTAITYVVDGDQQPLFAYFKSGKIICQGSGYLFCYFPIDSNK